VGRRIGAYVVLVFFGVVCVGIAENMRHRPEWARLVVVMIFAAAAYLLVRSIVLYDDEMERKERREASERIDLARRQAASPDDPAPDG
jgi:hypothetical protein